MKNWLGRRPGGTAARYAGIDFTVAPVVLLTSFTLVLTACSDKGSRAAEQPAKRAVETVPVLVAAVAEKNVPRRVQAVGNVEALATVEIKARIDGQIIAVAFKEGQDVTKGQVMFRIDPRPFEEQLRQAEAATQRDMAQLEHARSQERRYKELMEQNFVSKEAYAQMRTNLDTSAATVGVDRAAADSIRVQLEYCTIHAPISGRTGKILIQQGNLVKANDTNALVVINQISPIYVSFSVPEQYVTEVRKLMAHDVLTVEAKIPDAGTAPITGKLTFVDNSVDATTGTIRLKATFENADRALWPGQFVTAVLTLHEQQGAIVVPAEAVQTGPSGQYVFVVKPDMTVDIRTIAVDRTEDDDSVSQQGACSRRAGCDGRPVPPETRSQDQHQG